jgi:hypothetical protein
MMEGIEPIIRTAFPEQPIPMTFFGESAGPQQDMQQELAARIKGRAWSELSFMDWQMVGPVRAFREYMLPRTFAYYVPAFLVGAISEADFRDWALEAILPSNRWRRPRGAWWTSFVAAISDPQRAAIRAFLVYERTALSEAFDMVDEELIGAAETVWA